MHLLARWRKSWAGKKWRISQLGNHFLNTEGFNLPVFERAEGFGISVARRCRLARKNIASVILT